MTLVLWSGRFPDDPYLSLTFFLYFVHVSLVFIFAWDNFYIYLNKLLNIFSNLTKHSVKKSHKALKMNEWKSPQFLKITYPIRD